MPIRVYVELHQDRGFGHSGVGHSRGGTVTMPAHSVTAVSGGSCQDLGASRIGDRQEAEAYVASICFKHGPPTLVGAELEWVVQHSGEPCKALETALLAEVLGPHAPAAIAPGSPRLPLPQGSTVTVEPGGQLEISSPPKASLAELLAGMAADTAVLTDLLRPSGLVLSGSGADPVRPSQRLIDVPRYAAMESVFDRVGPYGRAMMCSTAAVQVCVDAGTDGESIGRWSALHDIGPALVAAFANSPVLAGRRTGWASSRMQAWLALDPPRTLPRPLDSEPAWDWARHALDSTLLCRRTENGRWDVPVGVTFADWLDGALPTAPTYADLDYHLTTLFPPVRPRGYLEVRYLDMQPAGQWAVPIAVVSALLADRVTWSRAREIAAPTAGRWLDAARAGLRDPDLCRAATALVDLAVDRLPGLDPGRDLMELIETVTLPRLALGRCPGDDLIAGHEGHR